MRAIPNLIQIYGILIYLSVHKKKKKQQNTSPLSPWLKSERQKEEVRWGGCDGEEKMKGYTPVQQEEVDWREGKGNQRIKEKIVG